MMIMTIIMMERPILLKTNLIAFKSGVMKTHFLGLSSIDDCCGQCLFFSKAAKIRYMTPFNFYYTIWQNWYPLIVKTHASDFS